MIFSCLIQKQRTLELASGMCGSVICRYADTIGRVLFLHALVEKTTKKEVQKKKQRAFAESEKIVFEKSVKFFFIFFFCELEMVDINLLSLF